MLLSLAQLGAPKMRGPKIEYLALAFPESIMICLEVLLGIDILLTFTDGVSFSQRFSMLGYLLGRAM